jgi:uncharacterized protein YutE (UPF0331/DUF86 family)
MVDPARLRRLLERLAAETAELRRLASRPDAALLADPDLLAAAKYRAIVAIEICIDVGEHIIASENLAAPETFADVFRILGAHGYLPEDLWPELGAMARFRNLLVHGYADVDDRRVVEILRSRLDDLDRFRTAIAGTTS